MTIILFLVDTSASMVQRNYMGCSAIDTAKSIVQDILKQRQRDINNRQTDRYMLFSTEDFPFCVKAGWKEGSQTFHDQLKALRPCGKFPLKQAILSAFYFVNLNRAQTGVDYYGHGRFPHLQEPVILIIISDSTGVNEISNDFELRTDPKAAAPGTEYTEEAFRWDQRMFSIVLRMSARSPTESRHASSAPPLLEPGVIQRVCASTGGRSFSMTSHKQQLSVIEQLTQMIHNNGIVLRFEFPPSGYLPRNGVTENGDVTEEKKAEIAGDNLRRALEARPITFMITRNRAPGHWPIPEAFWPESVQSSAKLPVRKAHPMLTIADRPVEAMVNTEFPFDKYELDHMCPLAEYVKERSTAAGANANVCWQVYVKNSHRTPGEGKPFGYLKTATNGSSVNLFLMPYNYPILLRLLDEQKADARLRSHPDWRRKLDQFVESCPSYYKQQLKKALARIKLTGGILDEPAQALYAPQMNKTLTNMKSVGKEEMDKLLADIGSRLAKNPRPPSYVVNVERRESLRPARNFRIEWEEERKGRLAAAKADEPEKKKIRSRLPIPTTRNNVVVIEDDIPPDPELPEPAPAAAEPIPNMMIDLCTTTSVNQVYRNPFSIEKGNLVQMLPRLRINLDQQIRDSPIPALEGGLPGTSCKLQTAYELHSQAAALMGNYDEYVKALEFIGGGPLREVEHRAVRENTFGNPFKKDKKSMAVDEVGEAPAAARENNNGMMSKKDRRAMESNRPPRRKAGPLAQNSMSVWRERRRTNSMSTASDMSHTAEDLTDDLNEAEASGSNNGVDVDEIASDFARIPSSSSTPTNGAKSSGAASPATSTTSRDSGVSEWGLDEEAEAEAEDDEDEGILVIEDEETEQGPPTKKAKLSYTKAPPSSSSLPPPPSLPPSSLAAPSSSIPPAARLARRPSWKGGEEATLERIRGLKAEVAAVVRRFLSDESMLSKIESLLSPLSMQALLIMTRFARDEAKRFKKKSLTSTLQQRLAELETVANGIP
ncbi:hypothetical protein PFISCL1PPCAC_25800 [Pristionchus fissidentatus]|uniref:VWFA domain-containing protein n=1 Tax=Pristionchus fissidentatus TaxID=1538716 RepID=A0AAV5WT44_9BILA|nr:hypothetical protein PFISCL1PPCAC_25800 [Pristionchus fissidentatus]